MLTSSFPPPPGASASEEALKSFSLSKAHNTICAPLFFFAISRFPQLYSIIHAADETRFDVSFQAFLECWGSTGGYLKCEVTSLVTLTHTFFFLPPCVFMYLFVYDIKKPHFLLWASMTLLEKSVGFYCEELRIFILAAILWSSQRWWKRFVYEHC